jgi:acetoin utilization protein AcuB
MLVGDYMSTKVISVRLDTPIVDALNMMKRERIRRLPVLDGETLVGIVSDKDLLYASPSPTTSLSVWEVAYLLGKLTIEKVMSRPVFTVTEDTPLEEAARIRADRKMGGLPLLRGERVVGIITETTVFKFFLELFGAREAGIRLTLLVPEEMGVVASISRAIADNGGNIVAMNVIQGKQPSNRIMMVKVSGIPRLQLLTVIQPFILELLDTRETAAS